MCLHCIAHRGRPEVQAGRRDVAECRRLETRERAHRICIQKNLPPKKDGARCALQAPGVYTPHPWDTLGAQLRL